MTDLAGVAALRRLGIVPRFVTLTARSGDPAWLRSDGLPAIPAAADDQRQE